MARSTGDRRITLGKTVTLLREGQRLSMDAAAAKADMSATTWKRVETGEAVRGLTYRAVEETLGLPRGVIDEYLEGKTPTIDRPREPRPSQEISMDGLPPEVREAFQNMVDAVRRSGRA